MRTLPPIFPFIITNLLMIGGHDVKSYNFRTEEREELSDRWTKAFPDFDSTSKRDSLCHAAKEYAKLDGVNTIADEKVIYTYLKMGSEEEWTPMIKCTTIPLSYLRLDRANDEIVIMTKPNPYLLEQFEIGIIRSATSCIQSFMLDPEYVDFDQEEFKEVVRNNCWLRNEKFQKSAMLRLLQSENVEANSKKRLNLCVAAKRFVRDDMTTDVVPLLLKDEVEGAQTFQMKFADGERSRVAIECPSSPPMYVLFKDTRWNLDWLILFVRGGEGALIKNGEKGTPLPDHNDVSVPTDS